MSEDETLKGSVNVTMVADGFIKVGEGLFLMKSGKRVSGVIGGGEDKEMTCHPHLHGHRSFERPPCRFTGRSLGIHDH